METLPPDRDIDDIEPKSSRMMVASDHASSMGIMINHAKMIQKGMLETANFLVQTRNKIEFILTPYLLYLLYILNLLNIHEEA